VLGGGRLDLVGEAKPAWSYNWQSSWSGDEVIAAPNTPNSHSFTQVTQATAPGPNALGYRTELLNLTRNVRVEGTPQGYSHVFVRPTQPAPSTIRNVAFRYVGPDPAAFSSGSETTGRYGLHLHMAGNNLRGTIVDGVVIRDTKNHAFVPHGSHGITIRNSIAYNVRGEAFWWDEQDATNDLLLDRVVAAGVSKASGGENHRMSAFFLGVGNNVAVTNSVAVGVRNDEKGANRSGFIWPEDSEATWTFLDNRAHNNESNGIFVWQNNELPHVIDGFIAYYNDGAGVEHGAYGNSYVYKNLVLRNNGVAVISHALGERGSNTDTQVWANIETGGGVLFIDEHVTDPERPVRFVNCDFGEIVVDDQGGPAPSHYDFVNCGLEPGDFDLGNARSDGVFRVQRSNGTAYRLTGNGSVTAIAKFYNGSIPATPGFGVGTFIDDDGSTFEADIEWLAAEGITKGCNPPFNDKFCPQDRVTRGQLAAFLVRALGYTDNGGGDLFVDDDGTTFEADIDKLGTAGVTLGCNPPTNNRYCPGDFVTRGQMAAFLVRAFEYTDDGGGDLFVDDDGTTFEADIDKLGTAGVTKGCNPPTNNRYCPGDFVTRGQMAAFLHRAIESADG
jgi:hypothetical protein